MNLHRLTDGVSNLQPWIERTVWILENHLDFLPQRGEFRRIKLGQVLTLENNLALGGFFQLKNTASGGGLAAAGFSHQPQGFTSFDAEVDAIHRFDQRNILVEEKSFRNREVHLQTLDFKEIFCRWIRQWFSLFFEASKCFSSAMFLDQFFTFPASRNVSTRNLFQSGIMIFTFIN